MPGLSTRSAQFGSAPPPVRSASPDGIWSKHLDSIAFDQLHKQEDHSFQQSDRAGTCQSQNNNDFEVLDPSLHPWGGLTTTKHGILTVLDCFMCARSLKTLQNVFDNARARERERELLYPDACGVGGRGWISQGMANYGRGHGARETCALHTARLSCDTLVDFWSALGEETRSSLLQMKEEDFIERLMYRWDLFFLFSFKFWLSLWEFLFIVDK
ncbi:hypothetical protein GW17_00054030 [Ensete ventricosum]|nr:hypothetical protein GW17_00054030 [Ensete ventricosum]